LKSGVKFQVTLRQNRAKGTHLKRGLLVQGFMETKCAKETVATCSLLHHRTFQEGCSDCGDYFFFKYNKLIC